MLQNYFKTAWRNMLHNRTSSLINISGLSIGIACTVVDRNFYKERTEL